MNRKTKRARAKAAMRHLETATITARLGASGLALVYWAIKLHGVLHGVL